MKLFCKWQGDMKFTAENSGLKSNMDARKPIGGGTAMTPKELVVSGLCGCTAMDVAGLLKKHKQKVKSFEIRADVTTSEGRQPPVFTKIDLLFDLSGDIDKEILLSAVVDSHTKYCGVSAMLSHAFPIHYKVVLNGECIGSGSANFTS